MKLDHCVFVPQNWQLFLALYVDDLLFLSFDKSCLTNVYDSLSARFKTINLGEISHYLGREVDIETGKISLQQTTYLKKIIERFQITHFKILSILMHFGVANSLLPSKNQADQATIKSYQSVIGSFLWNSVHTWTNISNSMEFLVSIAQIPASYIIIC